MKENRILGCLVKKERFEDFWWDLGIFLLGPLKFDLSILERRQMWKVNAIDVTKLPLINTYHQPFISYLFCMSRMCLTLFFSITCLRFYQKKKKKCLRFIFFNKINRCFFFFFLINGVFFLIKWWFLFWYTIYVFFF